MKLSNIIKHILGIIAAVVCVFVLTVNIVYINNIDGNEISKIDNCGTTQIIMYLGIIVAILLISYLLNKIKINKIVKMIFVIGIFIIYTIVTFFWVKNSITIPFADSAQIIVISKSFVGVEKLSKYCCDYLAYYPQQITLSAFFSGIFGIYGKVNYRIIEYINVICNLGSMLGLYFIIRYFSRKYQINKIIFFIFALTFLPVILLSTFVYGDFIGMMFMIWALYMALKFIESKKKRFCIFTGILASVGCLFRMNYIIFVIAIVMYWGIELLKNMCFDVKKWINWALLICTFVGIVFIPSKIIKKVYIDRYHIDSSKAFSTIPYLYMGMCEGDRGYGWYNNEMGDRVYHMMSDPKEQADEISNNCKEDLKNRVKYFIKNPMYTIKFYVDKNISMWAEPTMQASFYNGFVEEDKKIDEYPLAKSVSNGKINDNMKIYQKALIILILFGTILVIFFNRKEKDSDIVLFILVFLGGFAFHMLWEAKSRYIIPYYISLIPVASIGISMLMKKISEKFKKSKGNVIEL